jgi:integrase
MTINFVLKGKKEASQIYVRLKDTAYNIDTMAGTGLKVFKDQFKKGKIQNLKSSPKDLAHKKAEVTEANKEIDKQNEQLKVIEKKLISGYNNRNEYDIINAKWIKSVLNADKNKDSIPNELIKYYDYFINERKNDLSKGSVKKHLNVRNRYAEYVEDTKQTILIQQLDNQFRADFKKWFINLKGYHFNTFKKQIKELVTVCNYAKKVSKKELHSDTSTLNTGKEMKPIQTDYIFLSFKELKQIEETEIQIKELDITRDLLLICCFTGQRVSDFLNYSAKDIVTLEDNNKYLDIIQVKTNKQVYIPLNDVVLRILEKYKGNFPPLYSSSKDKNEQTFNKLVKRVGYHCGITEKIEAYTKVNNRLELVKDQKYKFISSHTGRRSFSTNYYGLIPTSLIITITGHSSEIIFKNYVKAKPKDLAITFTQKLKELDL